MEILAEGIDVSETSALTENRKRKRKKQIIAQEQARLAEHRQKLETKVESTVSNITDDPIMQSILADTATTTLREQLANEPRHGQGASPGPMP